MLLSTAIAALAYAGVQPARAQPVTASNDVSPTTAPTAQWDVVGDLNVGGAADGSVTIGDGGTVNNEHAVIGDGPHGVGTVDVSGDHAIWNSTGALYVGNGAMAR